MDMTPDTTPERRTDDDGARRKEATLTVYHAILDGKAVSGTITIDGAELAKILLPEIAARIRSSSGL